MMNCCRWFMSKAKWVAWERIDAESFDKVFREMLYQEGFGKSG